MANLYFEELQIGSRSVAGPYLLSKDEIIRFAKDPIPRHIDERRVGGGPLRAWSRVHSSQAISRFLVSETWRGTSSSSRSSASILRSQGQPPFQGRWEKAARARNPEKAGVLETLPTQLLASLLKGNNE